MNPDNLEKAKIDALYNQCNKKSNKLYDFAFFYNKYMQTKKDYGNGILMRMPEAHALTHISMNPGITVTQIAKDFKRTKSAISQTVTSLLNGGFIEKKILDGNKKEIRLYPTDFGSSCSLTHQMYDIADVASTTDILLKTCTAQEIDAFYKVLDCYLDLLQEEGN